ncbi:MAG: hypothetical protein AB1758_07165, partial [Candidatus Eremiobacterota bacterium]
HLILHKDAILVVAGELEVEDRVEVAFEAGENLSLRTAILVNGDIDLKQGVRHLKRSQKGQVVSPFNLLPNPFPATIKVGDHEIPNPVFEAFQQLQNKLFASLTKKFGPLAALVVGKVPVAAGDEDSQFPGLLLVSLEGSVRIRDEGAGAGFAGLILCHDSIIIEFPPDGSGVIRGFVISLEGDVQAFEAVVRHYPYFSSLIPIPIPEGRFQALQPHPVASGSYTP